MRQKNTIRPAAATAVLAVAVLIVSLVGCGRQAMPDSAVAQEINTAPAGPQAASPEQEPTLSLETVVAQAETSPGGSRAATAVRPQDVWVKPAPLRDQALRQKLGETGLDDGWFYDDLTSARREAADTGRPLLVVFRCVPCQCARTLDEEILEESGDARSLQNRFVRVRVVQMNGVNLEQFQFDRDLSFAALFMNADGTVYGRYGTRATLDRRSMSHISHASFRKAMERALTLHAEYPDNRLLLAGKQPRPLAERFPEEMQHIRPFGFPKTLENCIHCHQLGEAHLAARKARGEVTVSDIWPFPLPESVGLVLDRDDGRLVKSVPAGSAAARAGIRPGDELLSLDGQPLISQADVQWVLHQQPLEAEVGASVRRDGSTVQVRLSLSGNWRRSENVWRATLTGLRPDVELRVASRQGLGIAADQMALQVYYPREAAAKAGLRNGDVVVAVDGRTDLLTESDFLAYLYLTDPPRTEVQLTVRRKDERLQMTLPTQ